MITGWPVVCGGINMTDNKVDYRESEVSRQLKMFAGMVYSACRLGTWCFGPDREFYASTCPNEKECRLLLEASGCLDYAVNRAGDLEIPFILNDTLGLMWIGEYAAVTDNDRVLILLGPILMTNVSVKNMEAALKRIELSLVLRSSYRKLLEKIPVLNVMLLEQYARMLHYAVRQEELQEVLHYQSSPEGGEAVPEEEVMGWNTDYERSYSLEQYYLKCVREGNLSFESMAENDNYMASLYDYQIGNPLREAQDNLIIFGALCSRAAMEGGLPKRTAKRLEAQFIHKVEMASTIGELPDLNWNMLKDFINRVHVCRSHPEISRPIQECCDYIQRNFRKTLELEDISRQVGYSQYYLTKKFHKEMGIRLLDYIRDVRLEYARILLLTTDKSIQEISAELQFGTRNYFSRLFAEKIGMTPAQYRQVRPRI